MDLKKIVEKMTLEEKASLCSGKNVWETQEIERLNIPSIMMTDGPHGLRKQVDVKDNLGIFNSTPATCFPTAATTACSFDKDLLKKMGQAIGDECIEQNVDIILGPGVNIKRSPLCGRNFEYFSEDPFLSGELGAAFVRGVQEKGIGVSVKHYVGNNQEKLRQVISAEIDERALREIYLSSFERVVKEQPYTVMCSYNRVNGEYTSESKKLLTDILRDEWGYEGILITDWGACNDRVLGLKNGQDLEMPSSHGVNNQKIIDAVKDGRLDEAVLDQTVLRLLEIIFKCHQNVKEKSDKNHHELAREIARESMVLLKNENNILPLKEQTIGIIGELAKIPRYQGSGSSKINPVKLDNVCAILEEEKMNYVYAQGYSVENDDTIEALMEEAVEVAKKVDVPILFIGLTEKYESEGFDRDHMDLPHAHNHLVAEIAKVNPNVVVVLSGGAPVSMPWIDEVKGLLNAYLGGESGAGAIVDILFGKVNPSGKLAETYPIRLEDTPCFHHFPGENNAVYYEESIYVGYRYYEKKKQEVLYPFGFGLSYTTFTYDNLIINQSEISEDETLEVSFTIKNTGTRDGAEACQLYVRDVQSSVFKPIKELKGFEKVFLKTGEEKNISIKLDKRAFSYYHITEKDWIVESGEYEILVGASSQDVRLKTIVNVKTLNEVTSPYNKEEISNYYDLQEPFTIDLFNKMMHKPLEPLNRVAKRPYHVNSTMQEINRTLFGKLLLWIIKKQIKKMTPEKTAQRMMLKSLYDLPYRTLISFGGEMFNETLATGILMMINGKYFKGLRLIFKSRKK